MESKGKHSSVPSIAQADGTRRVRPEPTRHFQRVNQQHRAFARHSTDHRRKSSTAEDRPTRDPNPLPHLFCRLPRPRQYRQRPHPRSTSRPAPQRQPVQCRPHHLLRPLRSLRDSFQHPLEEAEASCLAVRMHTVFWHRHAMSRLRPELQRTSCHTVLSRSCRGWRLPGL